MSERRRLSLYELRSKGKELFDQNGRPFDERKYSRFKYGDGDVAQEYGQGLSDLVQQKEELRRSDSGLVIVSAPFGHIPIGANAIADGLFASLPQDSQASPIRAKMSRKSIPEGDYGALSEAERVAVLSSDNLSMDRDLVANKNLLIVDDIRITGRSAETIAQFANTLGAVSVWFLYAAQMHERQAKANAAIEARLNHAYVRDLDTLASVVATRNFVLNQRVAKFLLSYEDHDALKGFFHDRDTEFLTDMQGGIALDGLNKKKSYKKAAGFIDDELERRKE